MRRDIVTVIVLTICASSFATDKSSVTFYDSTQSEKTAEFGWKGDKAEGHFFVETPGDDGTNVTVKKGAVTARSFAGDGSKLTNLPMSVGVSDVEGLKAALDAKASTAQVGAKADTTEVKAKADTGHTHKAAEVQYGQYMINSAGTTGKVWKSDGSGRGHWASDEIGESISLPLSQGNVEGLGDSLGAKADTGWVTARVAGKADTGHTHQQADINGLGDALGAKADTGWVRSQVSGSEKSAYGQASGAPDDAVFVDADGNVGVGTASPTANLHVLDGGLAMLRVEGSRDRYDNQGVLAFSAHGQYLASVAGGNRVEGGYLKFGVADNAGTTQLAMSVNSSCNVGIGTSDAFAPYTLKPSRGLEVYGPDPYVGFRDADGGDRWLVGCHSDRTFRIRNDNHDRNDFAVDQNGHVGIGTTDPAGNLEVNQPQDNNASIILTARAGTERRSQLIFRTSNASGSGVGGAIGHDGANLILSPVTAITDRTDLVVASTGVGIGTADPTSGYKLDVNGAIKATGWASDSDRRYKTSIAPIPSALDKVSQLEGVEYEWNRSGYPDKHFPEGKQVGLIAQDVEEVVPEVVHTDDEGYKSMSYDKLAAVLVEAVKEQQTMIDELRAMNEELRAEMDELKKHVGD